MNSTLFIINLTVCIYHSASSIQSLKNKTQVRPVAYYEVLFFFVNALLDIKNNFLTDAIRKHTVSLWPVVFYSARVLTVWQCL